MKRLLLIAAVLFAGAGSLAFAADGPAYSLDSLEGHPYRFVPASGHASQNPGSPKYFVPGYGYQIPGSGAQQRRYDSLNTYRTFYLNGNRRPLRFSDRDLRYETNSMAGPWFHPGWPGNTELRSFAW